jgi:hypothetical protein
MPPLSLEDRVAALEQEVQQLKAEKNGAPAKDAWKKTIGIFTDDPGMLEIFDEALKIREADRAKARHQFREADRAKARRRSRKSKQAKK